jgi:hypothetical protein
MYMALQLTPYAIGKIFQTQFANRLEPYRSELRVSDFSTEGLFWYTYGHAPVYETLLGLIEALCVVLLFFRRTRPIGALLSLAVMSNVAAMNIFFDISAKFNSIALAVAALILVVLFAPVYRSWIATFAAHANDASLSPRALKAGLILKSVLMLLAIAGSIGLTVWIRSSLRASNALFGRWLVVSVTGGPTASVGVARIEPGTVVTFNRLNVLAIRSGELFDFGSYVENDASSTVDLSLRRLSQKESLELPPPGQREARAKALAKYPLAYRYSGQFERAGDRATLNLRDGSQPIGVSLRKM